MHATRRFRPLARAIPLALTIAAVVAPSAHAWHGAIKVTAVNSGGDAADSFAYTVKSGSSGTTLSGGSFSLKGGQSKTLSDIPSGGEGGASSWKPFVVAQTDAAGYTTTLACSIDPVWNGAGKDGSIWAPVYSAAGGEHRATVELRWWDNVAYTTNCTATNVKEAPPAATTLTVVKEFLGAPATATADLKVDGVVKRAGALSGQATDPVTVDAGSHSFGEATTTDSVATAGCVDQANALVPLTAAQDARTWSVAVAAGTQVTCTITNRVSGHLTIAKVTDPPSDDPLRPSFSFSSSVGFFSLAHGETYSIAVAPGSYPVTEQTHSGSTLQSIACSDAAQGAGASTVDVASRTATANIQPGEDVTCTFTNHIESEPGTTSRPRLKAAAAVRGARLSGTTEGCVADAAVAQVSGSHVKRVMFYVDGKAVRYMHRSAKGKYTLRHRVAGLASGKHKLRARVRFTRSSHLKPVTLKMQFERC